MMKIAPKFIGWAVILKLRSSVSVQTDKTNYNEFTVWHGI